MHFTALHCTAAEWLECIGACVQCNGVQCSAVLVRCLCACDKSEKCV